MKGKQVPLGEVAAIVRSKNAGPFRVTLDIVFPDRASYLAVKRSGVITPTLVAQLYRCEPGDITDFVEFDQGNAIKATIRRLVSSGAVGDTDVYGAQQAAPLLDIKLPAASLAVLASSSEPTRHN